MKFFVDTADVAEIRDLAATGLVDGITTNPSLVAKTGRSFLEVVQEICSIVPGPVSAEVTATDHETTLAEGRRLASLADNVCVKVPLTPDGLKTCKTLSDEGTKVNVTLCFSAAQALLAAKAGATYISCFMGRLDDISVDSAVVVEEIDPPAFGFEAEWSLEQVAGFLASWSGTVAYLDERGQHPLEMIWDDLASAWGDADGTRTLQWPLHLRIGRRGGTSEPIS